MRLTLEINVLGGLFRRKLQLVNIKPGTIRKENVKGVEVSIKLEEETTDNEK